MGGTLLSLAVGLQAVAKLRQQLSDQSMTHLVSPIHQFIGQFAQALASPAERGFWIAPAQRLDQLFQIRYQGLVLKGGLFASATGSPDTGGLRGETMAGSGVLQFL